MSLYVESKKMHATAARLIKIQDSVAHIDISEVLFLEELETKPKAHAKCFRLVEHPIGFFTDKKYCIVVYLQNCDWMSDDQRAILLWHEMLHIPPVGTKLIDHDVKDFRMILGVDLDWSEPGCKVPNVLSKNYGKKQRKSDMLDSDESGD